MVNESQIDITAWMVDPEEYIQELAEILLAQSEVDQELGGK